MSLRLPRGACLVAALAVLLSTAGCDDEAPPLAWLVAFEGAVRIDRADDAEGGSRDAPLYDGDWVSTGAGATATVRYTDRTEITVGEHTRFRIGGRDGRLTLELEKGTLLSNARQSGAGGVTVVTKYGRLQLLQGSEIQFSLGADGQSSMEVLFGRIELLSEDGGTVTVLQGETLDLLLGTRSGSDAGTPQVEPGPQPLPLQLALAAERGTVTFRPAGARRFRPASSEETPVPPGTEFRVTRAGEARLRGKGLASRLSGSATGTIGEAALLGEQETYALALERGATDLQFTHRGQRTVLLRSRGREVSLRSSDLGTVGVEVTRRGLELTVRAGKVELTAGEETRALSTGERVLLVGNVLGPTRKVTAGLELPHSRRVRVYANALEQVALRLPRSEAPVRVEVARDPEFQERLLSGVVEAEALIVPAPRQGALFWRAMPVEVDELLASGQARFAPDNAKSIFDLENPKAEVAETGLKATVLFQSVPPSLTFSFAPKPDAAAYRVRVFRAGELQKPLVERVVKEPRCTFEAGQIPDGEYLWNATPLAASGGELSGGRMNRLELLYDNNRTSLAIARPRVNEVVSASARGMAVQGIAPLGARLFVNGRPAPLDEKGRFSMTVPRSDTVVFRLVSSSGAEGYWLRQVRRGK